MYDKRYLNVWSTYWEANSLYDWCVFWTYILDAAWMISKNKNLLIPMWFKKLEFGWELEDKKKELLIKLPKKYGKKKGYKVRRELKKQARKEFFEWFVKS
jgi:hypothetical protein